MIFYFSCKLCSRSVYVKKKLKCKGIEYGLQNVSLRRFSVSTMCRKEEECNRNSPLKRALDDSASFQDLNVKFPQQQWITLPYVEKAKFRKQGDFYRRPKSDPHDASVILFPGQGAQYVGMANSLLKFPMAEELFELSNYILGYDLLKLCREGPKEELNKTKYCQPAVMVCSLAAIEKLKEERPNAVANCVATAGFSLGEITALVFAGALEFEAALKLVDVRATAMQLASDMYEGGMVIVMYRPDSKLGQACFKAKQWATDKGDVYPECKIANYLYPHCKVVSGSKSALEFLEKNYKDFNLKKIKRIPVSGAFHSELMAPAIEPFKETLNKMQVFDPVISVYSCVDGKSYKNAAHIRKQLPKQVRQLQNYRNLKNTVFIKYY
ncbi:hypothetical protein NQ315_003258 [Exocentrus adspersus]|uniref:[acyl-carrier-protein] S-malonyltransferase n=1 Tax=Exocentrus adspersus TaxID=1586481 RepID=A0AAV8VCQ9_9CUCU|nr:hypothetical protein NQ315_003258 [Exocentrus adspersus]